MNKNSGEKKGKKRTNWKCPPECRPWLSGRVKMKISRSRLLAAGCLLDWTSMCLFVLHWRWTTYISTDDDDDSRHTNVLIETLYKKAIIMTMVAMIVEIRRNWERIISRHTKRTNQNKERIRKTVTGNMWSLFVLTLKSPCEQCN